MHMTTTIYIVRHGEYENPEYVFPGRLPGYPLSPKGKIQVQGLAAYLKDKNIEVLYSSPVQRARESAEIIQETLHLPILFDDRLMEVRTSLEGISMKLLDETMGKLPYLPEQVAKGGESMEELSSRMYDALEDIRKKHEGKTMLVVTHGDPIRFGLMKYLGVPITFPEAQKIAYPLAGGYRLEFDNDGRAEVRLLEGINNL